MNVKELRCFVIVVNGNEASEYYYERIKESWLKHGFRLRKFDASTPDNYYEENLKFGVAAIKKYKSIRKEFHPTERAALTSHYRLWKKISIENISNNLIIEHDARLRDFNLFAHEWDYYRDIDVKLFGQGASCYRISPRAAKHLSTLVPRMNITMGPMAFLADISGSIFNKTDLTFDRSFERLGGEWNLPVEHVYNKSVGNTLDRYSNIPEEWANRFKKTNLKIAKKRWVFIGDSNE